MSTTRNPEKKQCNNYLNSSVLEFESSCQYDDNNHESNKNPDQWEDRMSKCRERNREHAKKTRLRKKMGLDGMKGRLLELQTEVSLGAYEYVNDVLT